MSWIGLIASASAASPAACTEMVPVSAWTAQLEAVEKAFAALDEGAFDAGMQWAALALPCLAAPVEPVQAGRYHRLVALRLYVRGDEAGARLAFAAARSVDPFGVVPTALLPPGHEARVMELESSTPGATEKVRRPRDGEVLFDGRSGTPRPADRPTLVQVLEGGAMRTTEYLAPGQPLPPYPSRLLTPAGRLVVGGSGLALTALSVTLATFAVDAHQQLEGELSLSEQHRVEDRAQGFTAGAAVSGALGLGGVVVAVFPW